MQDEKEKQEPSIVPSYQLSKDNYRMILPYEPSAARGVIVSQVQNRLDIDEMEEGLRRHSKEYFDTEEYYFREGQFLTSDIVLDIIDELNPKKQADSDKKNTKEKVKYNRENPRYLSHILEQNFLLKKDDEKTVETAGISIGIALKSVYAFQTEIGGPYYYEKIPQKEMLQQGYKIAQNVLKRLRAMDGLTDIPIMIALYREEEQGSPVPGNFLAKTYVEGGQDKVADWEKIKEENILFPSSQASKKYVEDAEIVQGFANKIAEYFPNYVGLIGKGFYINGEMKRLTIDVPIEFYGKGEVLGFTQYAYGVVKDVFPDRYDLEINIKSSDRLESMIYRNAGEKEPVTHIMH